MTFSLDGRNGLKFQQLEKIFFELPSEAKFFAPSGIRLGLPRHLNKQGGLFSVNRAPQSLL